MISPRANHCRLIHGVTTKRLNEQVKRNASRFPADFMFQLDEEETSALRSHIATSKEGHVWEEMTQRE